MSDKIQKITEKIYEEGIVKAKAEAADIINEAKEKAESILTEARKQETKMLAEAEKKAESVKEKTSAEIKMASKKAISKVKQEIINVVLARQLSTPLEETFSSPDFLAGLIITLAKNWNPENPGENQLQVLLPEKEIETMKKVFLDRGIDALNEGLLILPDPELTNGFEIGPREGNYVLRFSDQDFDRFFRSFLREETEKMLFEAPENEG